MVERPETSAQATEISPTDTRRSRMGAVVLHHSVTALMIMLIIALAVWCYLSFRSTDFFQAPDRDSRIGAYVEGAQKDRVHFALDVFFSLDGHYPLSLDELVERNLLAPSDLYYPAKTTGTAETFTYERTHKKYTLELASPLPSSPDDAPAEPIF